ncbi:hypothetical protein [Shewanella donghaensis]|uniref:hypothetical protein n=1 Tax=Shewanella donghaensis TaxID=238836 RepID=UPI001182D41B|nr:hypothetical protein [Shewanella donghaensis]
MKKISLLTIVMIQITSLAPNTSQADETCAFGYCLSDEVSNECKINISESITSITSRNSARIRSVLILQLEELEQLRSTVIEHEHISSLSAIDHLIFTTSQNALHAQQSIHDWPNTEHEDRIMELMQTSINKTPLNISQQQSLKLSTMISELLSHR